MTTPPQTDLPRTSIAAVLKIAGVVVIGSIMSILDITVVNVALPTFQRVFGSGGNELDYSLVAWTVDRIHARARDGHPVDRLGC